MSIGCAKEAAAEMVTKHFQYWLAGTAHIGFEQKRRTTLLKRVAELRGIDLACFCAEDAEWCHVDVVLEMANPELGAE